MEILRDHKSPMKPYEIKQRAALRQNDPPSEPPKHEIESTGVHTVEEKIGVLIDLMATEPPTRSHILCEIYQDYRRFQDQAGG